MEHDGTRDNFMGSGVRPRPGTTDHVTIHVTLPNLTTFPLTRSIYMLYFMWTLWKRPSAGFRVSSALRSHRAFIGAELERPAGIPLDGT